MLLKKHINTTLKIICWGIDSIILIIMLELFFILYYLITKDDEIVSHLKSKHYFTYLFTHYTTNLLGPSMRDSIVNGSSIIVALKISEKFIKIFLRLK